MNTTVSYLNTNRNFTAKSRDSRVFHSKCVAQVDIFAPTALPTGSLVTHAQSFFSSVWQSRSQRPRSFWLADRDRDLWPGPTLEVRNSRTSRHSAHARSQVRQIWLVLVSIYCVYKAIQNRNVVGPGQGSRYFQRMTKGTTGDEVALSEWRRVNCKLIWN